jgi:hypothetical protein
MNNKCNWKSCLGAAVLLALAQPALPAADTGIEPGGGMQATLLAHRAHFLAMELGPQQGISQNAEWLRIFLTDVGAGEARSADDWQTALIRLVSAGMREQRIGGKSGFIEDPAVVDLVVSALSEPDPETRAIAVQTLTWSTKAADLATFAERIKAALAGATDEAELRLLALLPATEPQRAALRERAADWPDIRARLGDADAARERMAAFAAATDYNRMRNLARDLGYIGTADCAKALVAGLRSEISSKGVHDDRSIRCAILVALGRIYQDEPLFTTDAWLLSEHSDQVFDQRRGLARYADEVNAWTRAHLATDAWQPQAVWFVRYSNRPRVGSE